MKLKELIPISRHKLFLDAGSGHAHALFTFVSILDCYGVGLEVDPQINNGANLFLRDIFYNLNEEAKKNGDIGKKRVDVTTAVCDIYDLTDLNDAYILYTNLAGQNLATYEHLAVCFNYLKDCHFFISVIEPGHGVEPISAGFNVKVIFNFGTIRMENCEHQMKLYKKTVHLNKRNFNFDKETKKKKFRILLFMTYFLN